MSPGCFATHVLERLLGEVLGIEAGAGRTGLVAEERLALGQAVPGAEVDVEVLAGRRGVRLPGALELGAQPGVAGPGLAQEDLVHQAGGRDELVEHLAVLAREGGEVGVERRRGELRHAFLDIRHDPQLLPRRRRGRLVRGLDGRHTEGGEPGQTDQSKAHSVSFRSIPWSASA